MAWHLRPKKDAILISLQVRKESGERNKNWSGLVNLFIKKTDLI